MFQKYIQNNFFFPKFDWNKLATIFYGENKVHIIAFFLPWANNNKGLADGGGG